MGLIFFILSWIVLYGLIRLLIKYTWPSHQVELDWRAPALMTALIQGSLTAVSTEILSAFQAVTDRTVTILWTSWCLALVVVLLGYAIKKGYKPDLNKMKTITFSGSVLEILHAAGICFILVGTGVMAWFAAPTNADAASYHLSRVMYWIQGHSVAHFATSNLRQLYQMPCSEFFVMHLFLLNHNDQLVHMPQWLAFLGCIIASSYIVKLLGGQRLTQWFAAVLTATLPIAILQSTAAKNDLLVAFWMMTAIAFMLLLRQRRWWAYSLFFSVALGLALLTKATAYVYFAPFIVWFTLAQMRVGYKWFIGTMAGVTMVVALLIGPAIARNIQTFGKLLGPSDGEFNQVSYTNAEHSPALIISNITRNIALQLSDPYGIMPPYVDTGVIWIHDRLGLSTADERNTYGNIPYIIPTGDKLRHEDMASNFFYSVVLIMALIVWCIIGRKKSERLIWYYSGALLFSFLLFCAYLRWQPWHSRLHLPMLLIGIPVTAYIFGQLRQWWVIALLSGVLIWQAQTYVLHNVNRTFFGPASVLAVDRVGQYIKFFYPQELISSYARAQQCSEVGFIFGNDENEYPFWVYLNSGQGATLAHVNVDNITSKLKNYNVFHGPPCAIITTPSLTTADTITYGGFTYYQSIKIPEYTLFLRLQE